MVDTTLLESIYSMKSCHSAMRVSQGNGNTVTNLSATGRVRTILTGTCSSFYSSDANGPAVASCEHSDPASHWRDSFSPSSDSLASHSSWETAVAASGCSSLIQLELTSSLPSDNEKKNKVILFLSRARHCSKCLLLSFHLCDQGKLSLSSLFHRWGHWGDRALLTCSELPASKAPELAFELRAWAPKSGLKPGLWSGIWQS